MSLGNIIRKALKALYRFVSFCLPAGTVLFIYLLLVNNFLGNVNDVIHADGVGYYDLLPSIFMRHDFDRKGKLMADYPELYKGVEGYPDYYGMKLNKYGCGTALLEAPFFAYAWATTPLEGTIKDGYQEPFHKQIFHAALFYLMISLLLLRGILERFQVRSWVIFLMQLLMALATSITQYANQDACYSHIYSLFAVSAFLYFAVSYFRTLKSRHLVLMLVALGLVILVRQMNVLTVLLLPFLAGSWAEFKQGISTMLSDYKWLLVGLSLFGGIVFLQSLVWHYQVGEWITYSYGKEGFDFTKPEFFNVLFSYRKGLFVYTPVMFIALSGVVWLFFRGKYAQGISWLIFFVVLTYVLSSWWCWFLGCSYGMRAYIDVYPALLIPFALMLDKAKSPAKYLLVVLALLCIPLNVIQTYQYKWCLMHWENMDKSKYWDIFLRTDDRYIGIFFKPDLNTANLHVAKTYNLGTVKGEKGTIVDMLFVQGDSLPDMSKVKAMQIKVDSDFKTTSDSKIILELDAMDGSQWYNWADRPLIHYREQSLGTWHTGHFNYMLSPMPATPTVRFKIKVLIGNFDAPMENLTILLWSE